MLRRSGLLLAFATVLLQLAVFLQPLLPEQYQIAPVCEHITRTLLHPQSQHLDARNSSFIYHFLHLDQIEDDWQDVHQLTHHQNESSHHHNSNHQCQYCVVYGNLVLPPELGVKEILDRIQVRLIAYSKTHQHVYFALQRLYLLPQGRAPPSLFT